MQVPSSQICAHWAKSSLVGDGWEPLREVLARALRFKVTGWSDGKIYEHVESVIQYVAEHLRTDAAEFNLDGSSPSFEIDNEQNPYIRSLNGGIKPLLKKLQEIDPFKLEDICAKILTGLGANANSTQRTNDGGIDFIAVGLKLVKDGFEVPIACKAAVIGQTKRYADNNYITERNLREFVGAANLRKHELGKEGKVGPLTPVLFAFWTTTNFEPNAKKFARASGIWYMDGDTLANYVETLGYREEIMSMQSVQVKKNEYLRS